jgi:cell division protein FtsA
VGGGHITNDLAVGLKTTLEQAERLKIQYGVASLNLASTEDNIKVQNVAGKGDRTISQADLAGHRTPRSWKSCSWSGKKPPKWAFRNLCPPAWF